ncbi:hypothetical protein [Prescottella equi]|uniref:hypothetical protein n=1 Tax=Rhodococcus hoagii TaxID=43767 RepID=UPI0012F87120|nr:hypothetical protein [Prescottella equi]
MYQQAQAFNTMIALLAGLSGADGDGMMLQPPETALMRARKNIRSNRMSSLLAKALPHQFQ